MDQTLVTSNAPGVHRGVSTPHPDVPETLLVEPDPSVVASRGDGEIEVSPGDGGDDRDDADDTTEPAVKVGADASANDDPRHVLDDFPER